MKNIFLTNISILAMAALGLTSQAQAAPITWGTATVVSADTDVVTTGTLVTGYSFDRDAGSVTINTVTFTNQPKNPSISTLLSDSPSNTFGSALAPFSNLSANYQALLGDGIFGDQTGQSVTLSGLTSGENYLVQIWINDSRASGNTRASNLTTTGGPTATIDYNNTDVAGGVGQFVIGTFQADATTQVIELSSNVSAQLNALQVRTDVVPEPGTMGLLGLAGIMLLNRRQKTT